MSSANGSNVLAIGIDAAEATFVRQLIERGEMPALRSLLEDGQWLRVDLTGTHRQRCGVADLHDGRRTGHTRNVQRMELDTRSDGFDSLSRAPPYAVLEVARTTKYFVRSL